MTQAPLNWLGIIRLGLVQTALGAIVAFSTSTLNRVINVEYALPALIPGALVAWHYAIQLSRPRFGYGSDGGRRRTPFIVIGMGVLAIGGVLATDAAILMSGNLVFGIALGLLGFTMIGAGVGAAGTSLLALLATRVAPERRPAAAAVVWIMMIVGFVLTGIVGGIFLKPFSSERLALVGSAVSGIAFLVSLLAVRGIEKTAAASEPGVQKPPFRIALAQVWAEPVARAFTVFVFISMVAYSIQDLILEPYGGFVFGMPVNETTQLSGVQNAGALIGMIVVGVLGARVGDRRRAFMRAWTIGGCLASAGALALLACSSLVGQGWPLAANVFALGLANGMFAVAAIGSMMGLASAGRAQREGVRMGVWGAAQAIAMGSGVLLGAGLVDGLRLFLPVENAFLVTFMLEAGLFVVAATLASRLELAPASQGFASEGVTS